MKADIIVPEPWIDWVSNDGADMCSDIGGADSRTSTLNMINARTKALRFIGPFLRMYKSPRILEIGSGFSIDLCYLLKSGLDVIGIEPCNSEGSRTRFQKAIELLETNGVGAPGARLVPGDWRKPTI